MGYTELSFADFVPTPDGAGYVPINGFPSTLKLPQHASALYDYLHSQKELVEPVSASELYRDIFSIIHSFDSTMPLSFRSGEVSL